MSCPAGKAAAYREHSRKAPQHPCPRNMLTIEIEGRFMHFLSFHTKIDNVVQPLLFLKEFFKKHK